MEISDKQKGLTRSVCISFVTFDGFTNLFPAEENDDKLLKKIEGREKRVEKRHAQQRSKERGRREPSE